jgi:transcriptional regulator with XRE-family HTH domain
MTKDKILQKLGSTLKKERERIGLTQEELANKANLHRTYIGFVERGERAPNVESLIKLSKGLGLKAHELLEKASL